MNRLEEGTGLDHVPNWKSESVLRLLGVDWRGKLQSDVSVAILQNVVSRRLGRKDIGKVDRWHVDERDADILWLVFPSVTVNYIKAGRVSKYQPSVPDVIEGRIRCPELGCISNAAREPIVSKFATLKRDRLLQCRYCDSLLGFDAVPEHVRT